MTTPKVSVIVPIYNQAPFIRETVDSVLGQDHPNIELVLSDDGSTDGTTDVLREYAARDPERVKVVASERNTGIAGAFNRALDAHTGEYIAWLGGDDVMLPGKLSRQVAALQARPEAIGCCHDAEVFDSDSGRAYGRFTEVYNGRRGRARRRRRAAARPGLPDAAVDDDGALRPRSAICASTGASVSPTTGCSTSSCSGAAASSGSTTCWRATAATSATPPPRCRTRWRTRWSCWRWPMPATLELHRLIRLRRVAAIFGEASRRWRAGDRRAALRYVAAAAGSGGLRRSFRVALRLVRVEVGRRRLGVTVPR